MFHTYHIDITTKHATFSLHVYELTFNLCHDIFQMLVATKPDILRNHQDFLQMLEATNLTVFIFISGNKTSYFMIRYLDIFQLCQ